MNTIAIDTEYQNEPNYIIEDAKSCLETITERDIKRAIRFAKVYARIHVPLKTKPLTQEIIIRRAQRAAKLWMIIFQV